MDDTKIFRVGSRKSQLALTQTELIISMLKKKNPDKKFEIITMDTIGDKILDTALAKIGDKNLFTKELEAALISEEVDFVVHSLKDMPSTLCEDFILACICDRVHTNDVVVFPESQIGGKPPPSLATLPDGSMVGTSSVRRVAQLKRHYPKLKFASIRGNLNTRIRKLDAENSEYAAIILAKAGVIRLGWEHRIGEELTEDGYAVGQGALACECRADDARTRAVLCTIHDEPSALTSICERGLMRTLDGGCSTPVAVVSKLANDVLMLRGVVLSGDGSEVVERSKEVVLPRFVDSPSESGLANGDADDMIDRCPKRRRVESGNKSPPAFGSNPHLILGLSVYPICGPAVMRMYKAHDLGVAVAKELLQLGADAILKELRQNAPAAAILAAPIERPLDHLLKAAAS